jgi:hypothetical protein
MGVVHGVVLVSARRDFAERGRIQQFAATKRGLKKVAITFASIQTAATNTGLGSNITRPILGSQSFIGVWSV